MTRLKFQTIENDVKKLVKKWYDARGAWSYAPIQTGMGEHGIPDRVGCVPVTITKEMIGMTIGVFVAVESKKPGRRGEARGGATQAQMNQLREIIEARGVGALVDGADDIDDLNNTVLALERGHSFANEAFKRRLR